MREQHEADPTLPALPPGFDGKALAQLYKDKSRHAALDEQQPESEALRLFMARWATDAPGKKAAANKVAKLEQERLLANARDMENQLAAAVTALQAEQLRTNMLTQEIRNLRAEIEGMRRGAGGSGDAHGSTPRLRRPPPGGRAHPRALVRDGRAGGARAPGQPARSCARTTATEYEFGRAEGFAAAAGARDQLEHGV